MLKQLKVQNYALIKHLDIDFESGLTTITGETGAGKSIILGALSLILGGRAETGALQNKEIKCVVEGTFDISNYPLSGFFKKNDIDFEDTLYLRREIAVSGKSRAFINDTPVTLAIQKALGDRLLDIHSQHQTMKLTKAGFGLGLLDALANHKELLDSYGINYKDFSLKQRELALILANEVQARKAYDFNTFQFDEIIDMRLQGGEREALKAEANVLAHAETIGIALQKTSEVLDASETSASQLLVEAKRNLGSLVKFGEGFKVLSNRLEETLIEVKDIAQEVDVLLEKTSVDPNRLEFANSRIKDIDNLLYKHNSSTIEELLLIAKELEDKIATVDEAKDRKENLLDQITRLRVELQVISTTISNNRHNQKGSLCTELEGMLKSVGIPEAKIEIELEKLADFTPSGIDKATILFSANRGSAPQVVGNVASGGELSRLMLCIKYLLADSVFLPTIIFDEIDTGISGEVARQVGYILKKMSNKHQVLVITHQPQVAALGNTQFKVYKEAGETFTETKIKPLTLGERTQEVATMLGGHNYSNTVLTNAQELLASSQ